MEQKTLNFTHPTLTQQWSHKNTFTPNTITHGSNKKVWWEGECGHEWEATPNTRTTLNRNCPYCSNQKTLTGYNDLHTLYPNIIHQIHPTKNQNLPSPDFLNPKSVKKIWWLCDNGHEWENTINNRTQRNQNCPQCARRKTTNKTNNISITHPHLREQWHPTKNIISIENVTKGSNYSIWWLCEKGHEWEASVNTRTKQHGCPMCSGNKTLEGYNDISITHPEVTKEWHPTKNIKQIKNTSGHSHEKIWWLCEKGHEWEATPKDRNRITKGTGCPSCSNNKSTCEENINMFINSLNIKTNIRTKNIIPPLELDIYIPEKNIAIEYNGLYWHSEKYLPKNYHYDKWLACKEKGIQLIQIWEDDWLRNPELIKTMISHKIGETQQEKIYARKTYVEEITKQETEKFLNLNHIQGYASGSHYIGLKTQDNTLVAVMVLKNQLDNNGNKELNLIRYATNAKVVGGFTKLLTYTEKTYTANSIITFADHTVSNGNLYENNGFIKTKQLPPDYMYVVRKKRQHKFGYRLKRFRNDPNLQFVEGLTERELAELNGLNRIWDAGKTKYTKILKTS